jgi:hypothetical protein
MIFGAGGRASARKDADGAGESLAEAPGAAGKRDLILSINCLNAPKGS